MTPLLLTKSTGRMLSEKDHSPASNFFFILLLPTCIALVVSAGGWGWREFTQYKSSIFIPFTWSFQRLHTIQLEQCFALALPTFTDHTCQYGWSVDNQLL